MLQGCSVHAITSLQGFGGCETSTSDRQAEWQRAPQWPPQLTRRPMPGAPFTAGTAHTCGRRANHEAGCTGSGRRLA